MIDQKPKSIYEFNKGDKITRVKPSKPLAKIGEEEITDRNFIGTPFIFVGIANGCIYLKRILSENTKDFMTLLNIMDPERSSLVNLEIDIFDEGWARYIDPLTLGEETNDEYSNETIEELKKKMKKAQDKEDFEEAARLKKIIESKK